MVGATDNRALWLMVALLAVFAGAALYSAWRVYSLTSTGERALNTVAGIIAQ